MSERPVPSVRPQPMIAVDRVTRQWAVAHDSRQADTARGAYDALYEQ